MGDIERWEKAYLEFETSEQEIRKFTRRLRSMGTAQWARDSRILESFCGRGNGLVAWQRLGFHQVSGIDLSEKLLSHYQGPAKCYLGDARKIPLPDGSFDIVSIQGGLHHLERLDDLDAVLKETHRVLQPEGKILLVEPWFTPFLRFVTFACEIKIFRKIYRKLDLLAIMTEEESTTYFAWLNQPEKILNVIDHYFKPTLKSTRWGKLCYVGIKRKL